MWMDSTLPKWPTPTLANDTDHPGLQVVDILTYYATKQFTDPRFVMPFDSIRAKNHFMLHVFEPDVCRPLLSPQKNQTLTEWVQVPPGNYIMGK